MEPAANIPIAGQIVGVIILIIIVLPAFLLARLTKIEHDDFYEQWVKDGRPHALPYWYPKEEKSILGLRSYLGRTGTLWLFNSPEWIRNHEKASAILRIYRILTFLIYAVLLGFFVLVLLTAPGPR